MISSRPLIGQPSPLTPHLDPALDYLPKKEVFLCSSFFYFLIIFSLSLFMQNTYLIGIGGFIRIRREMLYTWFLTFLKILFLYLFIGKLTTYIQEL